jgi:hypothetical protein
MKGWFCALTQKNRFESYLLKEYFSNLILCDNKAHCFFSLQINYTAYMYLPEIQKNYSLYVSRSSISFSYPPDRIGNLHQLRGSTL